jgi:predicted porin
MKYALCSAAALLGGIAASAASAQNVTVYGLIDAAVAHTTNVNAAGDSMTKMPSLTGSLPSRIGFRGTEDLGDGLQAIFTLENGFAPDAGTMGQGGRLFGRQASLGLKGKYGTLTLGRQINMTFIATQKSDVLSPNLFSISSIDLYLPNARSDNAIGYLGQFGGFTAGATWSFGRDVSAAGGPSATNCGGELAVDKKACRQVTALLGYEEKRFGVTASYDKLYGGPGAAGGLTSSANFDRRITLNGWAMLGETKIGGGVIARRTEAATGLGESNLYYLGASYPIQPQLVLDAQLAYRNAKNSDADVKMAVARLMYFMSKRTAAYVGIGTMKNDGASAVALDAGGTVGAGKTQNGAMAGLRHLF